MTERIIFRAQSTEHRAQSTEHRAQSTGVVRFFFVCQIKSKNTYKTI